MKVSINEEKMVKQIVSTEKNFDIGMLDDEQVERLKVKYQELAYESLGLVKMPVSSGEKVTYTSPINGHNYDYYPSKRRTAIAQYLDPHTSSEIVFYPQGCVRSYTNGQRSGMTNEFREATYQNRPALSEMMFDVLGRIVLARTIKDRVNLRHNVQFLTDVCGSKEEFEELCLTDEEYEATGGTWMRSFDRADKKRAIVNELRNKVS